MTKKCAVTGKTVQTGNNVSKSNLKTRRRFLPNLQSVALYSEILDQQITMKITSCALRTIEKKGGLDAYLLNTAESKLTPECKELRDRVAGAKAKKGL